MKSFRDRQKGRTLHHPKLPQDETFLRSDNNNRIDERSQNDSTRSRSSSYSFVVCADTQLGMTNANTEWETELAYARLAVQQINQLPERPAFCCCCGDLADMESTFYVQKGFTKEECDTIQEQQNLDFQRVFSKLHPDIAMVCLCGNHDVGNIPTKSSIDRYTNDFGDDYLGFWVHRTYHIVLNTALFSNPTAAMELYENQLAWLEERLRYAKDKKATNIFVFGHHPWFLYTEDEEDLPGLSPYPVEWNIEGDGGFADSYFHIPKQYRMRVMELFEQYHVDASFSGHFHQNSVSKASFGMDMIITSALSMVFQSTGKPKDTASAEPSSRGFRIVDVQGPSDTGRRGTYQHRFVLLEE
jgi:3',5'-cyclic AMP phosphodiesterase CpdA